MIFDFIKDVFTLIFKWMEIFPNYLQNFNEAHYHPQLYLTDFDTAISLCGNELFSILEKLFGGCQRCFRFFQKFGNEQITQDLEKVFANKDKIKGNGLFVTFLNSFGNMNGFDHVIDFITFDTKDSKGKIIKGCPFILILKALRSFTYLFEFLDRNFALTFAFTVQSALTNRLDNLEESEIKELDKDILREIVDVLKQFIQITDPQNADQTAEVYELSIAEKYLRCPFFEKRVRGINELKDIYYKVANAQSRNRNEQQEYTKWLNAEKYAQWILSHKIIEFIFAENPHVELIKRSNEILRLLSSDEKLFTPEIIDMLWSCCIGKHEDIVRATLGLIQELAFYLPLERLGQFFIKLQSIKENEFDEKMVNFLKLYTINTVKNIKLVKTGQSKAGLVSSILRNKKEIKVDDTKFYDLNKFWLIFQDQNKVPQKVKDLALNSLIEILNDSNDKEQKEQFIGLALDNIKRGDTFYSSIIFLRKILNTYQLESQARLRSNSAIPLVSNILLDVFKKMDLFDMIFSNTKVYLNYAKPIALQRIGTLTQGEKLQLQNFVSQANHEDFIRVIMDFIEFILVNSKVTLTFEHIEKMFGLFVTNAVTEVETNLFFKLITKENENARSKERKFLLDDKVRNEVFQKIFCNNNYFNSEKINFQGFICFKRLFLINNEEEKTLEIQSDDRVFVNNLNKLQGMDTLWSIAIQCEKQQVKDICKDFLVDLYLKIRIQSNLQKKQINELFPQKCLNYFQKCSNRPDYQLNCLRLIKSFISRFDGEHILEEDLSQFDPKELKPITVILNPEKAQVLVKIHPSQKFWQLKRKMANAYKLRLSEFFIKTKQGPLGEHVFDEQIREYKIEVLNINRVSQEEMEKEFPRYLIGYNKEYLTLFLALLQIGQEECKREVLSLLEILPINLEVKIFLRERVRSQVGTMSLSDWFSIFEWDGKQLTGKTFYFLMTLEDLMIPKRDNHISQEAFQIEFQTKQEFCAKLISIGGFEFLFEIFRQLIKNNLEIEIVKTKVITILLQLITHLFQTKQLPMLKQYLTPQHTQSLIQETLSVIQIFIFTVFDQQKQGGIIQSEERESRLLKKDSQVLQNAYGFLNRALVSNPIMIDTLYSFPSIAEVFRMAIVDIEVDIVQRLTYQLIYDISVKLDVNQQLSLKPSFFFMQTFINECLEYALKQQNFQKTRCFFDLMNEIFTKTEMFTDLSKIKPILQLTNEVAGMIFERDIIEMSARDEDIPLQGIFSFLKNIFLKYPEMRESYAEKNKLLYYLVHDCLFHKETRGSMISKQKPMPPKCKNNNTRDKCLELLNELCLNNTDGVYILIRYLKNYIKETFWRTPRKGDWQISVHQQERSLTGFVGLKNIGCICYMNSIMQQLFMIPTFRKSILEVDDQNFEKEKHDENVLFQLKMIFGGLMEMEKQYYNPKKFCGAFKDIDGSPIDPMMQRDVDEFFIMMIDRIENLIKGKKEEKVIKNLFQGVYANEFICKGCPHYSEREEPFLAITLQVKNKHSIKESLDSFVEGEMLEGDNAYYCEKCEKKVNTLKRCCIKRMPNVMFMVLKRFEFNYDTMTKFKINDYCEFPNSINMSEYSQEFLAKKDLMKEMEDKNLTIDDLSEEQREVLEKSIPQKYYEYNLKGAVIHIGTADQGHYISISQDRENPNGKWFEFNDHLVREFDPADIPYEAFGGDDDSFVNNINMNNLQGTQNSEQMMNAMKQLKTKIKNAYVLIYEREEIIDMEKFNEFMDDPKINTIKQEVLYKFEQCKLPKTSSAQIQISLPVHESILEKNKKFWLSRFIFNKSYIDSVLNIFKNIEIEEDQDYISSRESDLQVKSDTQLEVFKFLTTFFLTTVMRAKERKTVPIFMKMIRLALQKSVPLSVWLLETFSNQDLIKEFLIDCPIPDMKRFVAGLLRTAMQNVYKFEEGTLLEFCQNMEQTSMNETIDLSQAQFIKHHRMIDMKQTNQRGENINSSNLCTNVNVFIISHHNKELPILVLFINSLIHLSVSNHYFRNQQLSGQFYQTFAHFSELGEASRLYLLKNKTLGRMLDVFMNGETSKSLPQYAEKFRNEVLQGIPLFILQKELYLESNLEKNDVQLSPIERKLAFNTATPSFIFLSYTVSNLIRSCRFVKTQSLNPFANDNLNFSPDKLEMDLIINHEHEQWWNYCMHKVSRNAIADMFAHISFENKEYSLLLLQTILTGLSKTTFEHMKIYERPLVKMLSIKDQYQVDRTKRALSALHDIMKANTQFYKDVDSLIDIVCKLAARCPAVPEILTKTSPLYRFIEQYCKENPHFPLNQQKSRIFKQGLLSFGGMKPNMINQTIIDRVSAYSKNRLQSLQQIVNKEIPPNENLYDSDDDMYHHKFQEKERLDFYNENGESWYTGFIDIELDEMVKCVSENVLPNTQKPVFIWIETESDRLAQPHTQTFSEKRKLHNFYLGLLKNVQSQNQSH